MEKRKGGGEGRRRIYEERKFIWKESIQPKGAKTENKGAEK